MISVFPHNYEVLGIILLTDSVVSLGLSLFFLHCSTLCLHLNFTILDVTFTYETQLKCGYDQITM